MPNHTPVEYLEMPVRVTRDAVYIGDERIPGCIAEHGVTIKPGGGSDLNRLTIEFIVGPIDVLDPFGAEGVDHYCDGHPELHTLTTLTEGDWPRCGDCGGRLADGDPRLEKH